jgi:RNA polymerase sigma-70 factor (ECF subfamily)
MNDPASPTAMPDPDAEWVHLAREGDYSAFEKLVELHEGHVYDLATRIVRRREDAEDVVQQTFLSVMESLDGFAGESRFRTWLIRIATNHALKILRKRRGLPTVSLKPEEDEPAELPHPQFIAPWRQEPGEIAQARETQALIGLAMDELDDKYRLVFLLRDVEGLSVGETAEALGISESNVKVRLLRARLMLRERLTRALGDPQRQVVGGHEHPS